MSWMKNDTKDSQSTTETAKTTPPSRSDPLPPRPVNVATKTINLGKSIKISGDLSGDEDLVVDCQIEGSIDLKGHTLTVGVNAKIKADILAKAVIVVGEVKGNITAHDRVEICSKGTMYGDINSPRVALADGATFKGKVDMEMSAATSSRSKVAKVQPKLTTESSEEMEQRPN